MAILGFSANSVDAERILVNGVAIDNQDTFVQNNRQFVPVRFITENIGGTIEWDPTTQIVEVNSLVGDQLKFAIGSTKLSLNGVNYFMDVTPAIKNGRTYLPLRHLAEFMHSAVGWDLKTKNTDIKLVPLHHVKSGESLYSISEKYNTEVTLLKERNNLTSEVLNPGELLKVIIPYALENKQDLDILAKIIHAESEGESFKGKVAVGNIIINRVESEYFPNSVEQVIFQEGQFTPVKTGRINEIVPTKASVLAAEAALSGKKPVGDALYFFNPNHTNNVFLKSLDIVKEIGNHRFSK